MGTLHSVQLASDTPWVSPPYLRTYEFTIL